MAIPAAALAGLGILLLLLAVLGYVTLKAMSQGEQEAAAVQPAQQRQHAQAAEPQPQGRRRGAVGRMQANIRRRQAAAAAAAAAGEERDDENSSSSDEEGEAGQPRRQRALEQQPKMTARAVYEERRRQRDLERERQDEAQAAEAARASAAREAAEEAEAERWVGQLAVEGARSTAEAAAQLEELLEAMIQHIKERKIVILQDVAAGFKLHVQDVVGKIQSLESNGRIAGVMDDQGRFIYISHEEMVAVAGFIKEKGRVAIAELAVQSNRIVDLESKQGKVSGFDVDELEPKQ